MEDFGVEQKVFLCLHGQQGVVLHGLPSLLAQWGLRTSHCFRAILQLCPLHVPDGNAKRFWEDM